MTDTLDSGDCSPASLLFQDYRSILSTIITWCNFHDELWNVGHRDKTLAPSPSLHMKILHVFIMLNIVSTIGCYWWFFVPLCIPRPLGPSNFTSSLIKYLWNYKKMTNICHGWRNACNICLFFILFLLKSSS